MKIHDEMSQISVPEDLDEKTYQSILSAEKTVQKNRFRKKCAWSVLSCLVIIFGIIHVAKPGNGRKYTDYRKCILLYSGCH